MVLAIHANAHRLVRGFASNFRLASSIIESVYRPYFTSAASFSRASDSCTKENQRVAMIRHASNSLLYLAFPAMSQAHEEHGRNCASDATYPHFLAE